MALDHVVWVVEDLDAASIDFGSLGFTVAPGGEFARGGARNALIAFSDDTYLELFELARPLRRLVRTAHRAGLLERLDFLSPSRARFLAHAAGGPGLADIALISHDLDAVLRSLRGTAARYARAENQQRRQATGELVTWRMAVPHAPFLPFLIEPASGSPPRMPGGRFRCHANGAMGIDEVVVPVRDLENCASGLRALLGEPFDNARGWRYRAGSARLTWLVANNLATPVAGALEHRGERPAELRLRSSVSGDRRDWTSVELHGARLHLVAEASAHDADEPAGGHA